MKITITGTHEDTGREVSVQIVGDGHAIDKVVELFADALKGWSFHPDTVNEVLNKEEDFEKNRN